MFTKEREWPAPTSVMFTEEREDEGQTICKNRALYLSYSFQSFEKTEMAQLTMQNCFPVFIYSIQSFN